ncbi:MAG: hypothetical protein GY938_10995 [Ketobacter sp.]|nr:hypothetical protein [Ketobacter sp.]
MKYVRLKEEPAGGRAALQVQVQLQECYQAVTSNALIVQSSYFPVKAVYNRNMSLGETS